MNRVLKLQRVGLINPTVVEYNEKVLATNHLDIESTCNLWRCHFGFYPTEKIDLAMTKKNFSVIQQKAFSSVKSVYDLFYECNFIPRVFDSNEEVSKWDVYRKNEVEKLTAENAALRERLERAIELPPGDRVWYIAEDEEGQESYIISKPTSSLTVEDLKYELDKKCFSTREAAEKRLAELNGGKQ